MKEYGGYMEFEYFHGKEFHEGAYRFNTARHALRFVLREKGIREIYLPEYLCPVIAEACEQEGVRILYYPVGMDLRPHDELVPDDAWFYFINYYGQFENEDIKALHARHPHMIVDNVQAYFQKPVAGIDTLYTCRKFFGVPDGAYIYTDIAPEKYDVLSEDSSIKRLEYLAGRMEKDASSYYGAFRNISNGFRTEPIRRMSKFTENMMRGINYENVCDKRTKNFQFLHEHLAQYNRLNVKFIKGGYMYPFHTIKGEEIRKRLVELKIYVPVLWPGLGQSKDDTANKLAYEVLPLPIDQRYSVEDMNNIYDIVLSYRK